MEKKNSVPEYRDKTKELKSLILYTDDQEECHEQAHIIEDYQLLFQQYGIFVYENDATSYQEYHEGQMEVPAMIILDTETEQQDAQHIGFLDAKETLAWVNKVTHFNIPTPQTMTRVVQ